MKTDQFNQFKEEGLRIIDEDGVSFNSVEENELIHQEMADLNIDHASEMAADKAEMERNQYEYDVFGIFNLYGRY